MKAGAGEGEAEKDKKSQGPGQALIFARRGDKGENFFLHSSHLSFERTSPTLVASTGNHFLSCDISGISRGQL